MLEDSLIGMKESADLEEQYMLLTSKRKLIVQFSRLSVLELQQKGYVKLLMTEKKLDGNLEEKYIQRRMKSRLRLKKWYFIRL